MAAAAQPDLAATLAALRSGELDLRQRLDEVAAHFDEREARVLSLMPEPNRFERLHRDAEALLAQYREPASRPALFGALLGVKDVFRVDGFETRAGSRLPPSTFAGPEASSVTRLRHAGALLLGKTVSTEFAYFAPGPTRNPHDPERTPGGSSSGSAAAVGAGLCDATLGTQTIGSVTRPASFCGVVGFKPSFGRVPTDGIIPLAPGLDHVGFSVEATVEILKAEAAGEDAAAIAERIAEHNRTFLRSYHRFFRGIYKDKYFYMGEHDLLSASTLLDTAQYYIFVVIPAYKIYGRFHWMPVLGPKPAFFSYHLLQITNRRLKAIALSRRRAGEEGLRNDGRRVRVLFDLKTAPIRMVAKGLKLWLYAELDNVRLGLKNSLGRRAPAPLMAAAAAMPATGAKEMGEMGEMAKLAEMAEKRT